MSLLATAIAAKQAHSVWSWHLNEQATPKTSGIYYHANIDISNYSNPENDVYQHCISKSLIRNTHGLIISTTSEN